MIPDPRTLPVLSKGVLRRGVQISLGNIISTREQVGKLSTHSVEAAYLIVILTPESLSYRCSRFHQIKCYCSAPLSQLAVLRSVKCWLLLSRNPDAEKPMVHLFFFFPLVIFLLEIFSAIKRAQRKRNENGV